MRPRDVRTFRWPHGIRDKIEAKHGVQQDEVEESFFHTTARTRRTGGSRHLLLSQTPSGRYLFVAFDWEPPGLATILTARDMTTAERRLFRRK
jgi:uncharacterized DUF497 family protein